MIINNSKKKLTKFPKKNSKKLKIYKKNIITKVEHLHPMKYLIIINL
jgi:hypothetical protein